MRLIDADALIEKWYEVNDFGPEDRGAIFIGYTEIPRFINNAPTVQPTGDIISRADAIEAVKHRLYETAMNNMEHGDVYVDIAENRIGTWLSELPSAEAVPWSVADKIGEDRERLEERVSELEERLAADAIQGEWQKVEEQPYFRKHYDTVCCSVCRKKGNRKWNFCPNCGARMTPYKGGDSE